MKTLRFTFARFSRAVPYVLLVALLLSACAPKSDEPQPPEILYSQDLCDACGMIIDDARFAAATILLDGQALKFDDIGDMVIYHLDHPEAQVKAWFVHDYDSEAWIRGETAHFVKGDLKTPMDGSIAAFEDQTAADAFAAAVNGKLFTLDELRVEIHLTVHGG